MLDEQSSSLDFITRYNPTQPLATRYFEAALRSHHLAHAYVFTGQPLGQMYQLALDLAQVLNCENPASTTKACGNCRHCRWIQDNAHPNVITVSRFTYLAPEPSGKKSAHTTISGGQISQLITQLSLSTSDRRVVIFTDVDEVPASEASSGSHGEDHSYDPLHWVQPYEWRSQHEDSGKTLVLHPLTQRVFNQTAANRFLKTLEEPTPNTLFIFLTDSESSLLDTIVSRCQVLPFRRVVRDEEELSHIPESVAHTFSGMIEAMNRPQGVDPFLASQRLNDALLQEAGLTLVQALESFEMYLWYRWRQVQTGHGEAGLEQWYGEPGHDQFHRLLAAVEEARQQAQAKVHAESVLVRLFLQTHPHGMYTAQSPVLVARH